VLVDAGDVVRGIVRLANIPDFYRRLLGKPHWREPSVDEFALRPDTDVEREILQRGIGREKIQQ
jgi:hypothetical protein